MAYVTGSPVYAVADGQPVVYASLDGVEAWRASAAPADPFPIIAGDFIHYRQEDVTATGVTAAHGLPLHMDLVGALNRVKVGGVDYMDCTAGALDVVREPWPADTPYTVWMLHGGPRSSSVVLYNGPELYVASNTQSNSFTSDGRATRGDAGGLVGFGSVPDAPPETLDYHRTTSAMAGDAVRLRHIRVRRNGVELANSGAGGGVNWAVNSAITSNGPAFTIGGAAKRESWHPLWWTALARRCALHRHPREAGPDWYRARRPRSLRRQAHRGDGMIRLLRALYASPEAAVLPAA